MKHHFYLMTYLVMYAGDPERGVSPGARHIELQIHREDNTLPLKVLGELQQTAAHMISQMGVPIELIRQVVLVGSHYLGRMTEAEFMEGVGPEDLQDHPEDSPRGIPPEERIDDDEPLVGKPGGKPGEVQSSISDIEDKLFPRTH